MQAMLKIFATRYLRLEVFQRNSWYYNILRNTTHSWISLTFVYKPITASILREIINKIRKRTNYLLYLCNFIFISIVNENTKKKKEKKGNKCRRESTSSRKINILNNNDVAARNKNKISGNIET